MYYGWRQIFKTGVQPGGQENGGQISIASRAAPGAIDSNGLGKKEPYCHRRVVGIRIHFSVCVSRQMADAIWDAAGLEAGAVGGHVVSGRSFPIGSATLGKGIY